MTTSKTAKPLWPGIKDYYTQNMLQRQAAYGNPSVQLQKDSGGAPTMGGTFAMSTTTTTSSPFHIPPAPKGNDILLHAMDLRRKATMEFILHNNREALIERLFQIAEAEVSELIREFEENV